MPEPCVACGGEPVPARITVKIEGFELEVCADPALCIQRAKKLGIWKVYP